MNTQKNSHSSLKPIQLTERLFKKNNHQTKNLNFVEIKIK